MENKTKIIILVILLSFLINLSINLTNNIAGDSCWHLSISRYISENDKLPTFEYLGRTEPFWAPPLFHVVSSVFYKMDILFGLNSFFIRFLLPLSSLTCLIFLFLIAKKLYNIDVALYSIIFLAFLPIFIDYSSNYDIIVFLTLFVLGSVYFMLEEKILLSGLFFGLAILTKFNGFFVVFVLIYLLYSRYRLNLKKYLLFILSSSIGGLLFLRNYLLFGNPVWPFLQPILGGKPPEIVSTTLNTVSFSSLLNWKVIPALLVSLFGSPSGSINALEFVQLPFKNILFMIYIFVSLLYLTILIFSFKTNEKQSQKSNLIILLMWVAGFAIVQMLYIINTGGPSMRLSIPSLPAIAILWSCGFYYIINKINTKKMKSLIFISIVLLNLSFIGVIALKSSIAAKNWNYYNQDYGWIKENTPKDVLFYYGGQCLSINIGRYARYLPLDWNEFNNLREGYIFFNDKFRIERSVELNQSQQGNIISRTNCKIIYNNPKTKTKICKI